MNAEQVKIVERLAERYELLASAADAPVNAELRANAESLRALLSAAREIPREPTMIEANLAMLVRRLAAALDTEHPTALHAMDYLRRHGLDGSPLRAAAPLSAAVGREPTYAEQAHALESRGLIDAQIARDERAAAPDSAARREPEGT